LLSSLLPRCLTPYTTALLVMPGGADLPYCKTLNGAGVQRLRAYVQGGGAYLGLCAGAYFAASRCEFEEGTAQEVVGPRELALFPGVAHGSASPGFAYDSDVSAVAARVLFPSNPASLERLDDLAVCYLNGGCVFLPHTGDCPGVDVLARYAAGSPGDGGIAAVRCHVGEGLAVLCGPHPEMAPKSLQSRASGSTAEQLLRAELAAGDGSRIRLWRSLLHNAGMPLRASPGDVSDLLPPPSPLRSIAPGLVLPLDAELAGSALAHAGPGAALRGTALGPLRSTSTADLQSFPDLPACLVASRISEVADAEEDSAPPWRVSAPLPRLARWSAATAGWLALSAALRRRAPGTARASAVVAGACGCALGASVRFGAQRRGVPITAQTLAACLSGLVLGPRDGVRATALYAAAAAAGLPVLSPTTLKPGQAAAVVSHAPSAGFVVGFLACAASVGAARDLCIKHRASRAGFAGGVFASATAGQLATVLLGAAWAAMVLSREGVALDAAMGGPPRPWLVELALHSAAQVPPFLPGMLTKAAVCALAAAAAQPRLVGPPPPPQPALRRLLE
jgi:glutamine amidotransferase-like uncharacterized protein/biotin transporter BioY